MNTFLKTMISVASIAAPVRASYAAAPALVPKAECISENKCIADLAKYIGVYDGLTEIRDLGGSIETAQQFVYGNVPDGNVTRAEYVNTASKFVFPSSRPELYSLTWVPSSERTKYPDKPGLNDYGPKEILAIKVEDAIRFTEEQGAPSCTESGSIPLRAHAPLTAEEIADASLYGSFGGCRFQMGYDSAMRRTLENYQSFDINKDGVLSKADDPNDDNMITLEDTF